MIKQVAGDKIVLLPAWLAADWHADFKLHLMRGPALSGTVNDGKLTTRDIQPESQKKGVEVRQPPRRV